MRLTPGLDRTETIDLIGEVGRVLDQRLLQRSSRPIAIALSGGGDSVALLHAAADWAQVCGRRLLVLTVDHGLQPESGAWTAHCAALAEQLDLPFRALTWDGPKPTTGVSAAARAARHALLANAARDGGARVILLGHTADDALESRAMRFRGSSTPDPREWGPSPSWPEGRGLFLLRPMIELRRGEIRRWLALRDVRWIDDPANRAATSARAVARREIAAGCASLAARAENLDTSDLARACSEDIGGALALPRALLRSPEPIVAQGFIAMACLCAAGTSRPPAGRRAANLTARIRGEDILVASLAGARVSCDRDLVRFEREPGEVRRGGLVPTQSPAGSTFAWDGRFEIETTAPTVVRMLGGLSRGLHRSEREHLRTLGPATRSALPVVVAPDGAVASPVLAPIQGVSVRALALDRLRAACGLVVREPR